MTVTHYSPPSSSCKWSPHPSSGIHEFSYWCTPSWQVPPISFGGKIIFPQPSPSWQPLLSSHRVTVKSVFLGRHCRFVAGKKGIQDLRTMALGVASTPQSTVTAPIRGNLAAESHIPLPYTAVNAIVRPLSPDS